MVRHERSPQYSTAQSGWRRLFLRQSVTPCLFRYSPISSSGLPRIPAGTEQKQWKIQPYECTMPDAHLSYSIWLSWPTLERRGKEGRCDQLLWLVTHLRSTVRASGWDRVAVWEEGTEALCAGLSRPWEAQHSDPSTSNLSRGHWWRKHEADWKTWGVGRVAFGRHSEEATAWGNSRKEHSRKSISCSTMLMSTFSQNAKRWSSWGTEEVAAMDEVMDAVGRGSSFVPLSDQCLCSCATGKRCYHTWVSSCYLNFLPLFSFL